MSGWWREPYAQFALFAALVLAAQLARGRPPLAEHDPQRVVVDDALREELDRQLLASLGRAPTPEEQAAAVAQWVDAEVLVREARRLGLDRTDPQVRARLVQKMSLLAESLEVPPEPTDEALRALWRSDPQTFHEPARVTLRQLWAPDRSEAERLREAWLAGEDPRSLGAAPPSGPVLRARDLEQLAVQFGAPFADGVRAAPEGATTVLASTEGWHVVRVEQRTEGGPIPFEQARDRLRLRWQQAWLADARRRALESVRAAYQVEGWP